MQDNCELAEDDKCRRENILDGENILASMGERVPFLPSDASCLWGRHSCGERGEEQEEPDRRG